MFSEKLQLLRKNKGYTQEQLSEVLGVSRQAVAKWENGMSFPDILNLIQISEIMNVSVDYLVKDQQCSVKPANSEFKEMEQLISFRLQANRNTYAGFMNESESTRYDSHDFNYTSGKWTYHDTYVGSERFAGEEAVWKTGKAVYAMNYMGRVLSGKFSGNFLKEALRAADEKMPYRGPEYYKSGEYIYKCNVTGDIFWFQGYEHIYCGDEKVYECFFHGGLVS